MTHSERRLPRRWLLVRQMLPRRQPTANLGRREKTLVRNSALSVRARGKDVSKLDMEIVSAVHRALTGRVGHERFAVWFGRGVRMEPCGKTLRIAAADTFRLDSLRRLLRADLLEATRIAGSLLNIGLEEVEFVVDASLSTAQEAAQATPQQPVIDVKHGEASRPAVAHQLPLVNAADVRPQSDGAIRAAERFAPEHSS